MSGHTCVLGVSVIVYVVSGHTCVLGVSVLSHMCVTTVNMSML